MTTTLAVTNQKGGVGKTATTFHLARAAILDGLHVLVIDADPQGNLSVVITADPPDSEQVGLADALSSRAPETLADVIVPGIWDGLDVVPTPDSDTLGAVRDELVVAGAGREMRLREALEPVAGNYDLVLIDSGPSIDQLTANTLTAADAVVIVTAPKLFSTNGLANLRKTIDRVRRYYNPQLRIAGVLVNLYEEGTVSGQNWLTELTEAAEQLSLPLLTPPINKRVMISDSLEAAKGIDEWSGPDTGKVASLYRDHFHAILEGAKNA